MEAGCPHDPCTWGYKTKLQTKKHWASLVTLTHVNKDGNGAVYSSPCSLAPSKSDENLFVFPSHIAAKYDNSCIIEMYNRSSNNIVACYNS